MESCTIGGCPFAAINWLWYAVSVIITFGLGLLWYSKLCCKKTSCKDDECETKSCCGFDMVMQVIVIALLGLMYFMLIGTGISYWYSVLVAVVVSGWIKMGIKWRSPDWNIYVKHAMKDAGYFFAVSIIFILFAMIQCGC